MLIAPDFFAYPAKDAVSICQSAINLFANAGVRRDGATQVSEKLNGFELCLFNGDKGRMLILLGVG